jgi:hypothetical protein
VDGLKYPQAPNYIIAVVKSEFASFEDHGCEQWGLLPGLHTMSLSIVVHFSLSITKPASLKSLFTHHEEGG